MLLNVISDKRNLIRVLIPNRFMKSVYSNEYDTRKRSWHVIIYVVKSLYKNDL